MTDDFGLDGPYHARRRDALRQYAGDVAELAAADAMPERKRQARDANALWVQGLDKARKRVAAAEAGMGDACRDVARRVACHGHSREQVARRLGYVESCGSLADATRQVGWMLVLAADCCVRAYEVREAA